MRQRGFTLIELMATLAVASVLLSVGMPSLFESIARARLEGAVNELATDLQYARSEAVRERATVVLRVAANGGGYIISNPTVTLKTVSLPVGVTLSAGATVSYDALRGLSEATTFAASVSGLARTLRVTTNALGRVQVCAPAGKFGSSPAC